MVFTLYSLLALSPDDVLPAVYLCTNKIAADHENKVGHSVPSFSTAFLSFSLAQFCYFCCGVWGFLLKLQLTDQFCSTGGRKL